MNELVFKDIKLQKSFHCLFFINTSFVRQMLDAGFTRDPVQYKFVIKHVLKNIYGLAHAP